MEMTSNRQTRQGSLVGSRLSLCLLNPSGKIQLFAKPQLYIAVTFITHDHTQSTEASLPTTSKATLHCTARHYMTVHCTRSVLLHTRRPCTAIAFDGRPKEPLEYSSKSSQNLCPPGLDILTLLFQDDFSDF